MVPHISNTWKGRRRPARVVAALGVLTALVLAAPAQAAPANDAFAAATDVSALPAAVAGTVREATVEAGEPGASSVWYRLTAARTERIVIEIAAESAENCLGLRVGAGASAATFKATHAVTIAGWAGHRLVLDAVAGAEYRIAVSGCDSQKPAGFELRVHTPQPPANDAFADARRAPVPGVYTGVIADATGELGEPETFGAPARQSVWFKVRATWTHRLAIDSAGTECYGIRSVAVYTGDRLGALRRVAIGRDVVRVQVQRGRTYRVALDCTSGIHGLGRYAIEFSDGSIHAKGVSATAAPGQTVEGLRTRGLRLTLATRRAVELGIELRVRPAVARALGLETPVLGRLTGKMRAGETLQGAVMLSPAARRALRDEATLDAVVRLTQRSGPPDRFIEIPMTFST